MIKKYLVQVAGAMAGGAIIVVAEALFVDPEIVGGALLTMLFLLPSVLIYSFAEWTGWISGRVRGGIFLLSLLPLSVGLLYSSLFAPEGTELARLFAMWYVSGGIASYAMLFLLSPRHRAHDSTCAVPRFGQIANGEGKEGKASLEQFGAFALY